MANPVSLLDANPFVDASVPLPGRVRGARAHWQLPWSNKARSLGRPMASSHQKEVTMGDKSPKSKQRNKKQKEAAKVRTDQKKQTRKEAQGPADRSR